MKVFDAYILKNLFIATIFTAVVLAVVIFLTQSLRFLELVMETGASGATFWILTFLALPRFFEIILPLSLMAAVLFIYNRMSVDSELVVVRSVGFDPLNLAKPALILAAVVTCFLWFMTMWAAPKSLAAMQMKRQEIKAQFSTLIFREGVFNRVGNGLTVYVRKRAADGRLLGLMIHDSREDQPHPVTVLAESGDLIAGRDGYEVVVYDGLRQEYDVERQNLSNLSFKSYTINFPAKDDLDERWQQPDERTIFELLNPDETVARDVESRRDFKVELHRRIISPLLTLAFALMGCATLLIGPVDRRGQMKRIILSVLGVVCIQGLYIASFNMARQSDLGFVFMYSLVLIPIFCAGFLLSPYGDILRRELFYKCKNARQESFS